MRKVLFIFGELADSDIEWLVAHGTTTRLRKGDVLIQQGLAVGHLYLVLEGSVSVSVKGLDDAIVAVLQRGEIVGEMSFIDTRPSSATAAAADDALVLAIPRDAMSAKLRADPAFAARFYRAIALILSDRLRSTVGELAARRPRNAASPHHDDSDEIDPGVLEQVHMAGLRFERVVQRLVPA